MKLKRIRLHPFGATLDKEFSFGDGVNVVEGPNEFGKSTLSRALWHALFTPTNLTPVKAKKILDRWAPRPGGDHARVDLEFEADGAAWSLRKTWGVGAGVELRRDGGPPTANPVTVQERLLALLKRNEATWRTALFLRQSDLGYTLEQLKEQSSQMDDLTTLLAGAEAIPEDIPSEKLARAIAERVQSHFGHWDRRAGAPEKGRGIDNPWVKEVGPLLAAHYATERVRAEWKRVRAHEMEVDRVNAQVKAAQVDKDGDADFVQRGRALRDGLAKRGGLEERLKRLLGEETALREIFTAWPRAAAALAQNQRALREISGTLEALETELTHARKRAQAEQVKATFANIEKNSHAHQTAAERLAALTSPSPEALTELKALDRLIDQARIQIEAQKLTAKMESTAPIAVTVTRGAEAAETVQLAPKEPWTGHAEGKTVFDANGLRITVASGTGEVEALFEQLDRAEKRRARLLSEIGHANLAEAEAAVKQHQAALQETRQAKAVLDTALQGRTEAEWRTEIAALNDLPETRAAVAVEAERGKAQEKRAGLNLEIRQDETKTRDWAEKYREEDHLMTVILENKAAQKGAEQELAQLPAVPEGFPSADAYLKELTAREARHAQAEERLRAAKLEQARLSGMPQTTTAEELAEEGERLDRAFQREKAKGESLSRIQRALDRVTSRRGAKDPLEPLAASITARFTALTEGRYRTLEMSGLTPAQTEGLGTTLLSQGTLDSLALATRLSLAELYLEGMDGFLVLDDPFTDMDPARRQAATTVLTEFAQRWQVIYFTCHPDHAEALRTASVIRSA